MIKKRLNNYKLVDKVKSNSVDLPTNNPNKEINDISNNIRNKRKYYLNTSVIKDKTPRKLNTHFLFDNTKRVNNNIKNKNNYYLNTMENNNYNNINNNNIHKYTDEGRYLTYKENDNMSSKRTNQFYRHLFPMHKRHNFSQEQDKKRKDNEIFEIVSPYGRGNSFIVSNKNNFIFNKDRNYNKILYKNNLKYINQFNNNNNKNIIYEKQKFVNKMINNNKIIIYNKTVDKIIEYVEKITENKVNLMKHSNSSIQHLECQYKEGASAINFILNISKNTGKKDCLMISPKLIRGNTNTYKLLIEKIKNILI